MIRLAALILALALPWAAAAQHRVVSMNLCTDQLALLVGAPRQVISVSALAQDPASSPMAEAAAKLPANHGQAEEIFLMHPDLVLAGAFSNRATVDLLRRLGLRVEVFPPAYSLEDVRANILGVGAAMGRAAAAQALADRFAADLAALRQAVARRPRAALYFANGYTLGDRTLSGQILAAAGFDNIAAEAGLSAGGTLALERLILAEPEVVLTGRRLPGAARAEEILDHPALRALMAETAGGVLSDRDWICGTPQVLQAIGKLTELREGLK